MKQISIITINRNNKEGLFRTINSVVSQTFLEYEYIVIDGASSDGSVGILKQFKDKIDYWISESDTGIYNAMNKGIQKAKSEYCIFMNSGDCFCHDNVLKEIFLHNLYGDIICGNALFEQSENHKKRIVYSPNNNFRASDIILSSLPHQSTLIKTKLFHEIHLYNESYSIFSDWAFVLEMIFIHNKKYQNINVLISRCDTTGISSNPKNAPLMELEYFSVLRDILPRHYQDYLDLNSVKTTRLNLEVQLLDKVAKSNLFKVLLFFRRKFIRLGLYDFINNIKSKFRNYKIQQEDRKEKKRITDLILKLNQNILPLCSDNENEIIVSLTSYGKRVSSSAPFAIYSLFKQEKLPHRIILFLDHENWNEGKLPKLLKRLQQVGLEIYYCPDIRSYKKLVPTLERYPESIIITVDDDVYYNSKTVGELFNGYISSDKRSVICHWAAVVEKRNSKYNLPSEWQTIKEGNDFSLYAPIGVGGVLYPPRIFDKEIFNSIVFQKLAPTADDLWFWVMELRNNVNVILLKDSCFLQNRNIDRLNQMDNRKSDGLFVENCLLGKNDEQLLNLIEYYHLS